MEGQLKQVLNYCEKYAMLSPEGCVLAAVSGGADSMCLLHMLLTLAEKGGFTVAAAHYNHQIRGEEAERDERFVREFCQERNIPFYAGRGDVPEEARARGLGVEETAREMRYAFLEETAREIGAGKIATAHTADDNVETVLFNMARGAGLKGMCGIPPVRGVLIRPLLPLSRKEVLKYLEENGVFYVEDSTNAEDAYTRNKIRHHVVPVLKEMNPALCRAVADMTELFAETKDFVEGAAARFLEENFACGRVSAAKLRALHPAAAKYAIKMLCGESASFAHVEAVYQIAGGQNPSASVEIPGKRVFREYDALVFEGAASAQAFAPFVLKPGQCTVIEPIGLKVSCKWEKNPRNVHKSFNTFLFKSDAICGNITIRPRLPGDKICFSGRNGTKSIKKLFIEEKVPVRCRQSIPIVSDDSGPIAVYGFGVDRKKAACRGETTVLKITFEEIM